MSLFFCMKCQFIQDLRLKQAGRAEESWARKQIVSGKSKKVTNHDWQKKAVWLRTEERESTSGAGRSEDEVKRRDRTVDGIS